jgi:hypothetical protein
MLRSSDNYRQNQTHTETTINLKGKNRALFSMAKNLEIRNIYVEVNYGKYFSFIYNKLFSTKTLENMRGAHTDNRLQGKICIT